MKFSHSKLCTILDNPMQYYLSYEQGISLKEKKTALLVGSCVHWLIENNTEDSTEFFDKNFRKKDSYTSEAILAESMAHGYFKHKNEIFDEILTDPETGEKLTLIEETHELEMYSKLKSFINKNPHDFMGIIDLLLLTNKGVIIIDYKTSSSEPDWNKYLEQIYRYVFILQQNFPEIPIIKIGIINLKKAKIRQKKNENDIEFLNRLKWEYELDDEKYVNYHEYTGKDFDKKIIDNYIENLSRMCDVASSIVENKMFFINYSNVMGVYGKSDYYDIIYGTENSEILYEIKDIVWNDDEEELQFKRDCRPIDMKVIDLNHKYLNKFETFYDEVKNYEDDYSLFLKYIRDKYIVDEDLLEIYFDTVSHYEKYLEENS